MTPLLALGVKSPDISNALAQYDKSRNAGFLENVNNQKMDIAQQQLGMEQEKHDFKMQQDQASAVQAQEARRVQREQDVMKTLFDFANRADTPAKWKALTTRLSKMYGEDSIKGFEDFSQRPNALNVMQKATAQIQNYNFRESLPEEKRADFDKVRSGMNINMPGQEKAFDKEVGKSYGKEFEKIREKAAEGENVVNDLAVAREILSNPNVYAGTGGNLIQGIKKFGNTFMGLNIEGVGEGEALQTIQSKIALDSLSMFKGSTTDKELDFAKDMQLGLGKSQRGNELIIGLKEKSIEYNSAIRDIYEANGGGRTPEQRKAIRQQLKEFRKEFQKEPVAMLRELRKLSSGQKKPTAGSSKVLQQYNDRYNLELE